MSHHIRQRKHLFVDPKIQGALIVRVVLYWIVCLITFTAMLFCWRMMSGPVGTAPVPFEDMWLYYRPAILASFLLLPMVIIDIIQLSNRFVGPLLRLRRSMRALARGEDVEPLEFRGPDFCANRGRI